MNQTEFQNTLPPTQTNRCLQRLQKTPGDWVSLPDLYQASGSWAIHSRISDLRKRGHVIEQHSQVVDGQVHSSYRLIPGQPD